MTREEQQIHKAVAAHLRARGAIGLVWWHTPNGGRRGRVEAAILKGLGVRAGVSDITALHRGKFYALELKAPGGKPTGDQLAFLHEVREQGGFSSVATGIDDALQTLEFWGLLRGSFSNSVSDHPSADNAGADGAVRTRGTDHNADPVRKARGSIGGAA